ncbi:bifunctional adenosylcobinamide kinase/adenosylcobinamide-phosphate guanylyltransferase [Carnimonas bestiolae]|uniref:bifunctional adenosylcobinamide kinase/adenosylcobinamide-phosphate guanylyltransferase n=1 Tax=Carnimonas bestiolae TaxID=3402172 RepID=UPI003EDC67D5
MLELVLGGARSGKSRYAEQLASDSGREVHYLATAEAWDDEMAARIASHRHQRPASWTTHEVPRALAEAIGMHARTDRVLLIDCLTLWLTNQLLAEPDQLSESSEALVNALGDAPGRVIAVSNETGLGVVPNDALSRRFVDHSGWLHQRLAARADRVWWVVAGLPQCLKGAADGE